MNAVNRLRRRMVYCGTAFVILSMAGLAHGHRYPHVQIHVALATIEHGNADEAAETRPHAATIGVRERRSSTEQ